MKNKYTELSIAKTSKHRNTVISKHNDEGFTIAQQFEAKEDGKPVKIFMKGALHVDGIEGLENLKEAISEAIRIETSNS